MMDKEALARAKAAVYERMIKQDEEAPALVERVSASHTLSTKDKGEIILALGVLWQARSTDCRKYLEYLEDSETELNKQPGTTTRPETA